MHATVKRLGTFAAALCLALVLCSSKAPAKEYNFYWPIPKNLSMGSVAQLLKNASKAIEKKTGFSIAVVEYKYAYTQPVIEELLNKMSKKEIDFAMVFSVEYIMYLMTHKNANAIPLFSATMFGKPTHNMCMYTRKSDNITKPEQLNGKIWGGVRTRNIRYLLYMNGIDKPLGSFFKTMKFIPEEDITLLFNKLLNNEIDVFTMPDWQVKMGIGADKRYKDNISSGACVEYEHNWMFVYRNDIPKEDAMKLKETFVTSDKNPDFAQFKFLMSAIRGKFVDIDLATLKNSKKIADLFLKRGWMKDEMVFIKANMK